MHDPVVRRVHTYQCGRIVVMEGAHRTRAEAACSGLQVHAAVSSDGFHRLGPAVAGLELPTVVVQEGVHHLQTLGLNAQHFLSGLLQRAAP